MEQTRKAETVYKDKDGNTITKEQYETIQGGTDAAVRGEDVGGEAKKDS